MADIETMWVWIPRYSYSIGSEDGTNYYGKQGDYLDSTPTVALPGEIDVKFVDKNTKDRGTARYVVSEGIQSDSWYTPDAFTFGNEELSGIWVGKFETSSSNPSVGYGGGNTTSLDPMIKPNVTRWRNITVSNAFNVSLKMNDEGNRYGFSSNVDTHMMKNSEWAVVAYLSQSRYGKFGNVNYIGSNKELYQNKSNFFITGCSSGSPSSASLGCQYTYDANINGTGASTTGTIYGIYDMNGSAWEYVMGNYNDEVSLSGFATMPESKYYDKYTSSDGATMCSGKECISHNLSETAGWYGDLKKMVNENQTWFCCGGYHSFSKEIGMFYVVANSYFGDSERGGTFRLVISPNVQ